MLASADNDSWFDEVCRLANSGGRTCGVAKSTNLDCLVSDIYRVSCFYEADLKTDQSSHSTLLFPPLHQVSHHSITLKDQPTDDSAHATCPIVLVDHRLMLIDNMRYALQ